MTVSIDSTTKKYHGRKAETYESVRTKQERWDIENATVEAMLVKLKPQSVLDVPVGTGRFIPMYDRLKIRRVVGIDVSSSMLATAHNKTKKLHYSTVRLICKDVRQVEKTTAEVSVCVRFLDLIDEEAMRSVMKTLMRLSSKAIICTIRFGPTYVPKSNTATHDEAKFLKLLSREGWHVARSVSVFKQGWQILLLKPR